MSSVGILARFGGGLGTGSCGTSRRNNHTIPKPTRRPQRHQAQIPVCSTRTRRSGWHLHSDLHITRPAWGSLPILGHRSSLECRAPAGCVDLSRKLGRPVSTAVKVGRGHGKRVTVECNGGGCVDGRQSGIATWFGCAWTLDSVTSDFTRDTECGSDTSVAQDRGGQGSENNERLGEEHIGKDCKNSSR